jgi:ribonuclease VapC
VFEVFIDASVLVAVLLKEPEARQLAVAMDAAGRCVTSPLALYETVVVIMSKRATSRTVAEELVRDVLETARIEVVPITDDIGRAALDVFDRYGKGRGHPAQLNMGDCFAYGAARVLGVPLLYKGDDFARTDLAKV